MLEKRSEQTEQSSWELKVFYFNAAQTSLFLNPLTTSLSVFLLLLLRIPISSSIAHSHIIFHDGAMTRYVYSQLCHFTLKPSAPSHRSEKCLGFFCASLTSSILVLGCSSYTSSSYVLGLSLLLILDSQFVSLCVNFLSTWNKLESFEKVEPLLRKSPHQNSHREVCGAITGLAVLGCIRKQMEQVMESKTVNSVFPWPLLQFLPLGFLLVSSDDEL